LIYIVCDNLDEGQEVNEVATLEKLGEFLKSIKNLEGGYQRIEFVIFGEEVAWDVIRTYYNLEE
jgi:hypothetical protein